MSSNSALANGYLIGSLAILPKNSDGKKEPQRMYLKYNPEKGPILCTFGADPSCDVKIFRSGIKPKHCALALKLNDQKRGQVYLIDYTFANKQERDTYYVVHNDVLTHKEETALESGDFFFMGGRKFALKVNPKHIERAFKETKSFTLENSAAPTFVGHPSSSLDGHMGSDDLQSSNGSQEDAFSQIICSDDSNFSSSQEKSNSGPTSFIGASNEQVIELQKLLLEEKQHSASLIFKNEQLNKQLTNLQAENTKLKQQIQDHERSKLNFDMLQAKLEGMESAKKAIEQQLDQERMINKTLAAKNDTLEDSLEKTMEKLRKLKQAKLQESKQSQQEDLSSDGEATIQPSARPTIGMKTPRTRTNVVNPSEGVTYVPPVTEKVDSEPEDSPKATPTSNHVVRLRTKYANTPAAKERKQELELQKQREIPSNKENDNPNDTPEDSRSEGKKATKKKDTVKVEPSSATPTRKAQVSKKSQATPKSKSASRPTFEYVNPSPNLAPNIDIHDLPKELKEAPEPAVMDMYEYDGEKWMLRVSRKHKFGVILDHRTRSRKSLVNTPTPNEIRAVEEIVLHSERPLTEPQLLDRIRRSKAVSGTPSHQWLQSILEASQSVIKHNGKWAARAEEEVEEPSILDSDEEGNPQGERAESKPTSVTPSRSQRSTFHQDREASRDLSSKLQSVVTPSNDLDESLTDGED